MKYILLTLLLLSGSVQAGPQASYIMPGCINLVDITLKSTGPAGYCAGVINATMVASHQSNLMCPPIGIHTLDIAHTVISYKDIPGALDRDFISLVIMVLTIEYPCPIEDPS